MNKKFKTVTGFIAFIVSPLIFFMFFQNCSQKYQTEATISKINSESKPESLKSK